MNKNKVVVTIKTGSGSTWDTDFNVHQKAGHVLHKAVEHFGINPSPAVPYQLVLVTGSVQRTLNEDISLEEQGVVTGSVLVVCGGGPAIDG